MDNLKREFVMQQQTVEGKERSKEVLEGEPYEVSRNYNEKEGVLDLVREIKLAVGENPDIKIQAVAGNIKIVGATDIDTATLRAIYRVYGKTEEEAEKTIGRYGS
jgi:predicted RNA-binding protein with TRAM domain